MSIRTIRESGIIVGFQAILGAGGPGCSAHFPVRQFGGTGPSAQLQALRAAKRHDAGVFGPLRRERKAPRWRRAGRTPIRLIEVASVQEGYILHAEAAWRHKGRVRRCQASTRVHGLVGAIARLRERIEADLGPLGLTDRQILAQIRAGARG